MVSVILISFLGVYLDGFFSNYLPYVSNHILLGINFSLVSIVILYFIIKDNQKYLLCSFIVGLIYGILYSSIPFLYASLFLLIAYLYQKLYFNFSKSFWSSLVFMLLMAIIYEVLIYIIYVLFFQEPLGLWSIGYRILYTSLFYIVSFLIVSFWSHKKVIVRRKRT